MGPYLLISFFFGFSFVIAPNSGADSTRYAQELKQLYDSKVSFDAYFSHTYSEESSKLDIYQPLLTWLGVESCCRASIAFYNDTNDIDALISGLNTVWSIFNG